MYGCHFAIAARYSLALILKKAQQQLAPHQYGAGIPDGCTQIVQSLQHLLTINPPALPIPGVQPESAPPYRPMACLSIDMANAFNAIDRAAMLSAIYTNPDLAQCWIMVGFGYGQPSLLLMRCDDSVPDSDAFIESQTGVRQGDPLAALLFSLTMHPVYDSLARVASKGCYAYVDDGHFVGTIDECWKIWELLPSKLEPLGLSLNAAKCQLTCFHMDHAEHPADHLSLERFRASPLTINALRLLGCVIGMDDVNVSAVLHSHSSFRTAHLAAIRRIPQMKKQTGMLALQHLTGKVVTNRVRAMTPAATLEHCKQHCCPENCSLSPGHRCTGWQKIQGTNASIPIGGRLWSDFSCGHRTSCIHCGS